MIPSDFIAEWRSHTRWATDEQVEQDLVLCRALVQIFQDTELANDVALGVSRVRQETLARVPGEPWKGQPKHKVRQHRSRKK